MSGETYFLWGIAVGIGLCVVSFPIVCCLMDRLEEWWYRHRRRRGAVIQEAIEKYKGAIEEAERWGNKVGQMLVKALKPIITDIDYSLGWAEAGVDTICLWSEKYKAASMIDNEEAVHLSEIVEEVFGEEFRWHIDCPFGIWLPPDVAEKAKKHWRD